MLHIFLTKAHWEDPWEELDIYEERKHLEKPFRKGKSVFWIVLLFPFVELNQMF